MLQELEYGSTQLTLSLQRLLGTDRYRYDDKWERDYSAALQDFFGADKTVVDQVLRQATELELESLAQPKAGTTVIDLRQASDFDQFHLPGSVNMPFVQRGTPSPFSDTDVLEDLWGRLENTFKEPDQKLEALIQGKRVLLVCYDGNSSRVAASVLRAKGCEADCIRGGLKRMAMMGDDAVMVGEEDGKRLRQLVPPAPSHIAMPVSAVKSA